MLIDLLKARAGMIVGEDIIHPRLGIMVRKLQPLTTEMISSLLRAGITSVHIQETDNPGKDSEKTADFQSQAENELVLDAPAVDSSTEELSDIFNARKNANATFEILIHNDKMTASVFIYKPRDENTILTEEQILRALNVKGVTHGILRSRISELVQNFSNKEYPMEPVVIAEGTPSKNGRNGSLRLLFSTETSLKPQENPDGSVDYKNIAMINTVNQGQKLAELIPPMPGIAGKNIFGQILPTVEGTPAQFPKGSNTEIDPDNPNLLIAVKTGFVRYSNSIIEVNEGLVIPGDVDFSTGNIRYGKNVVINGDVKSGFEVDCGGDLQVNGTIEDCKVSIEGNLLCRLGFTGQGKGIVEAKGNINLNFTKNQIIKSGMNINIAKEAINCSIFARNSITVHGKPLSIAGGTLIAGDSITFFTVGNHTGIKTILEVGLDFTLNEEMKTKELLHGEMQDNLVKLQGTLKKYEKLLTIHKQLPPKDKLFMDKLIAAINKYKQNMNLLESQIAQISLKMNKVSTAFIKIERSALPGTMFKFGERHFLVKEEIIGPKTVHSRDHEIKVG